MSEPFSKFIAIVFALVCMIFIPLSLSARMHDEAIQNQVYSDTVSFVEKVREQGMLTQEMYNMFIRDLDATGYLYDVEIEQKHTTVIPVFKDDGSVRGTKEIDVMTYEEDILKKVFTGVETTLENGEVATEEGVYYFSKGDYVTVTVRSRETTDSGWFFAHLFGGRASTELYAVYGGVIRDENF